MHGCTRDTRSHGSHGQNLTSIPHNTNPTHKRAHALNRATSLEPTETNRFKHRSLLTFLTFTVPVQYM